MKILNVKRDAETGLHIIVDEDGLIKCGFEVAKDARDRAYTMMVEDLEQGR